MGAAFLALLLPAALGLPRAGLETSLRAEARSRPSSASEPAEGDLQLEPSLSVQTRLDALIGRVSYFPRLTLGTGFGSAPKRADLLHRGQISLAGRAGRGLSWGLSEQLASGENDFSALAGDRAAAGAQGPLQPLQPLPTVQTARYFLSDSRLTLEVGLARRWRLGLVAGYQVSGGADEEARRSIPLQRGPQASVQVSFDASRLDQLGAVAAAAHADFSTERSATTTEAQLLWRHRFTRLTGGELGAGLGMAGSQGKDLVEDSRVVPVLSAGVDQSVPVRGQRLGGSWRTRWGPVVDRIQGTTYSRLESRLSLQYSPLEDLAVVATGNGFRTLGTGAPLEQVVSTELGASYPLGPYVGLSAGVRGAWSRTAFDGSRTAFSWLGFLGVQFTDRRVL